MPKRSAASEPVRRSAGGLPPATADDKARLLAAMVGPIDTSDIPEKKGPFNRIHRDAAGRLPARRNSSIRQATLAALERRKMTRYQLWADARLLPDPLPVGRL